MIPKIIIMLIGIEVTVNAKIEKKYDYSREYKNNKSYNSII